MDSDIFICDMFMLDNDGSTILDKGKSIEIYNKAGYLSKVFCYDGKITPESVYFAYLKRDENCIDVALSIK